MSEEEISEMLYVALKKVRHCVAYMYSSISLRFKTAFRNHLDVVKSNENRIQIVPQDGILHAT